MENMTLSMTPQRCLVAGPAYATLISRVGSFFTGSPLTPTTLNGKRSAKPSAKPQSPIFGAEFESDEADIEADGDAESEDDNDD
jgi:hypothetical protein